MPFYRRYWVPGGTYFFTAVAHERRPILTTDLGRRCLRNAFREVAERYPFELFAVVLLPDHLHAVWTLPSDDANYSLRWKRIKEVFTEEYLAGGGTEGCVSASRRKQGERGVWQRRFWEHAVRDEDDLSRCVNYVHWNPVKHGLVTAPRDYLWSSFQRFVEAGDYDPDWGNADTGDALEGAERVPNGIEVRPTRTSIPSRVRAKTWDGAKPRPAGRTRSARCCRGQPINRGTAQSLVPPYKGQSP